jgi:hypothetical protein
MHETGSVLAAATADGRCCCGRGLFGRLVGGLAPPAFRSKKMGGAEGPVGLALGGYGCNEVGPFSTPVYVLLVDLYLFYAYVSKRRQSNPNVFRMVGVKKKIVCAGSTPLGAARIAAG